MERDEVLLLRLDRFIQFLYTSSVIISLEFVFLDLRLTVSEDLLPLSIQESPNLFTFRVLPLNFVTLRVTCVTANNGFTYLSWLIDDDDRQNDRRDRLVSGTH